MPFDHDRRAPHLGQHSQELLRELGRTESEISALFERGAVG